MTELVDDLTGKGFPEGTGESVSFSVNGIDYVIDLNDKNAAEFHRKLDYYISRAARVGGRKRRTTAPTPAASSSPVAVVSTKRGTEQVRAIRTWANDNGYKVSHRGRIPHDVEAAFAAAH